MLNMARHWFISAITAAVSLFFAFLIGVYAEQIREMISSATGQPDATNVYYLVVGVFSV
jgi:K+-sensing histidine kinase KdpD